MNVEHPSIVSLRLAFDEAYYRWSEHYAAYRAADVVVQPPLPVTHNVERVAQYRAYWDHYRSYWDSRRHLAGNALH